MIENLLLVVAKKPIPGVAKTRLCPPLNPEHAAELYGCFLQDTLNLMRKVSNVRLGIAYLPVGEEAYFRNIAPEMALIPQRGNSLGERLDNLLTEVLGDRVKKAVVIGSDSPNLPVEYLAQAFELLTDNPVVLGPAEDGGYYLVGMKEPHPDLLRRVQMSTLQVLEDTIKIAEATGVGYSLLPVWYDVDTMTDLMRLRDDIFSTKNQPCTCSFAWLRKNPLPGES